MSCTSTFQLIPLFYAVAEQQWVQAPEPIKHCLPSGLFAFHAVNFFCPGGTSASTLLFPHLPRGRVATARAQRQGERRKALQDSKTHVQQMYKKKAIHFTKKSVCTNTTPPHTGTEVFL